VTKKVVGVFVRFRAASIGSMSYVIFPCTVEQAIMSYQVWLYILQKVSRFAPMVFQDN
jgi:hypothetical protein